MDTKQIKIVIAGGGFAGVNLIKGLANDQRFNVTLVDVNNYHHFPPLLYQVATAFIEPSNISYPFRRMLQKKANLRFHMGTIKSVNTATNSLMTDTGSIPYDFLVLAIGTESNFFGMENVKQNSLPMKTINDAIHLRNHMLLVMEKASRLADQNERQKYLNIVIAGGGPTGVEVAGMLAEMNHNIAKKDYPEFADLRMNISLVDAGPVVLGPMSKKSQAEAGAVLRNLGVNIINNTAVKDYADDKVLLSNAQEIPCATLVWASGVIGREIAGIPGAVIGKGRRILTDGNCRVKETQNLFAIGDIALHQSDPKFPQGHPQLAQVAIQQGKLLAENFKRMAENKPLKEFIYNDKGSMAIISKYKAVVDMPNAFVKGFLAWVLWLFVHIIPLVGFRNKVQLAFSWFWSFVTNDPTLRLIIRPSGREKK